MFKQCEWCKKEFEVSDNSHGRKRRFCNTSCSAKWRNATFGPNIISDETKQKNAEILRNRWKNPEFRKKKIEYMKTDNPVYKEGVIEKTKAKILANGGYKNNFKYGNGKMSEYEKKVEPFLSNLNFIYNYAIPTKVARDVFPEKHYAINYKPDFVNLKKKICVEIDGPNHLHQKEIDQKKDDCLQFLGFTVLRFTHNEIDDFETFKQEIINALN